MYNLALKSKFTPADIEKMEHNLSHWEANAKKFKSAHSVSWGDINIINMEIENILEFLKNGDKVLDAGCSNGFSTFEISNKLKLKIRAFDYSETSIKYALAAQKKKDKKKQIAFYHGNMLNIEEINETFDKVYTIRVLINLLDWELQKKAILEMHRVLKPGGLFLMSEAFVGGLNNINSLRATAGFSKLVMHDFNLYLDEPKLEKFLSKYFKIIEIRKFSSIYYVASRFMRYLTIPKNSKDTFINPLNDYFAKFKPTDNSGDFGVQKLYVLKKK